MSRLNPSRLRADLYRVLDSVIDTGKPVEIERNGHVLRIALVPRTKKLDALVARPEFISGDPSDLVDVEWSGSWKP